MTFTTASTDCPYALKAYGATASRFGWFGIPIGRNAWLMTTPDMTVDEIGQELWRRGVPEVEIVRKP